MDQHWRFKKTGISFSFWSFLGHCCLVLFWLTELETDSKHRRIKREMTYCKSPWSVLKQDWHILTWYKPKQISPWDSARTAVLFCTTKLQSVFLFIGLCVLLTCQMLLAASEVKRCVLNNEWRADRDGWLWSAKDHYIEGHCRPLWIVGCVDLDMASS